MSDQSSPAGQEVRKRFRSPPYPAIGLAKAIERARQLHGVVHHHAVGVSALGSAWDYGEKSSGLWAAAAALLQYGLLTDEGSGDKRKFRLTEAALRIVRDPNPESEKRRSLIQQAALKPKIHQELWERYGAAIGLSDVVLKSYLTVDRLDRGQTAYSDSAADEVIQSYKDTIAFAGLGESDSMSGDRQETEDDETGELFSAKRDREQHLQRAKVGDFVQWTADGADQFRIPRKVEWVSEDGSYVRVFGSQTGIPMDQITVVDPPAPAPIGGAKTPPRPEESTAESKDISVLLVNGRLQITADVDAKGLRKLMDVLAKYEEILALI